MPSVHMVVKIGTKEGYYIRNFNLYNLLPHYKILDNLQILVFKVSNGRLEVNFKIIWLKVAPQVKIVVKFSTKEGYYMGNFNFHHLLPHYKILNNQWFLEFKVSKWSSWSVASDYQTWSGASCHYIGQNWY